MRIRTYRSADAPEVGVLIASTYAAFNLSGFPAATRTAMLGPFARAASAEPEHRRAIAEAIDADIVLIATHGGAIVGVLRGRPGRLQSLFVAGEHHRRGVGSALVGRFESEIAARGSGEVRVAATRHGVPFYQAMGYRKTTGERRMRSFDGDGLPYQPMKKTVAAAGAARPGPFPG